MKITSLAHSNIALIKYWGKRDKTIILPHNSSISLTLDKLFTKTTVEFDKKYKDYEIIIDGIKSQDKERDKIIKHIEFIKKELVSTQSKMVFAKIVSNNSFPKKAGLASSASGFAALTLAVVKALGLNLDKKDLSILARQGSGSASRSIFGGFVEWVKGENDDGSDSFARKIASENYWPELRMIVAILTTNSKKIGSRSGMELTVKTSPFYNAWLKKIESDLETAKKSIVKRDFESLGKVMENNALKMHSTMITSNPPLFYWEPETITVMKKILELRESETECYFTIDAGPQVKILCLENDVEKIKSELLKLNIINKIIVCKSGNDAQEVEDHLF